MDTAVTAPPLRILHLEDSVADHRLVAMTLRRARLEHVLQQVDHFEAFQHEVLTGHYDLILADYRLPSFTAVDAWQWLEKQPKPAPFILLSGAIGEAAAVDVMRLGIADYLLKDDMARLPHAIERALEVHRARLDREQAMADLAQSQQHLAELTEYLQRSIEQERTAIAREIHDDIGGALTAVNFDLAWMGRHSQDAATQAHVASAIEMLQHAIGASQRIMMDLRPAILDQGLLAAIQWLAAGFERRTSVITTVQSHSDVLAVSPEIQVVAFRTAQEALTNITKYAAATKVHIDVSDHEGTLTLEITDNGQGIAAEQLHKPRSFGLKGLKERARTVAGWLDISSRPGQGTSIILSVPLGPLTETSSGSLQ